MNSERQQIAVLMRQPLDAFIAARNAAVRELLAAHESERAARIAALRKPNVVVWALDQAGALAADDLDTVRAAADRLRTAQERLIAGDRSAGQDMQRSAQQHRAAIDTVTRRLGMVLTGAGHATSDDTLRRIGDGLRHASLAGEQTWSELRAGCLTTEPAPAPFPAMDGAIVTTALERTRDARADQEAVQRQRRVGDAEEAVRRAEQLVDAAREQVEGARRRHQEAIRALEAARATLRELQAGD